MITQLVQPLLYLFILGTALSTIVKTGGHYKTFLFPGILGMTLLFTSIFSAMTIVWDREFGFLREMLVSPVRRWAIVIGKCLGGTTTATVQGTIILALAGTVGVPYNPVMLVEMFGIMVLTALTLNALGVLIAARIKQMMAFQSVMMFVMMPMFFLSGAMYPLSGLPPWLAPLTKIDPVSYSVDALRRTLLTHLGPQGVALRALSPGMSWDGWRLPVALELAMILATAIVLLVAAVSSFSKTE